ncbi:MAG TPA: signal peptide prediction [Burkholderiales bacterium]|nr:signal peptide prediction [Burkholderiales bacterium]
MSRPALQHRLLRLARYTWAAPCSAIGLLGLVPAIVLHGQVSKVNGVLEVALSKHPDAHRRLRAVLPFSAITFGHVVVAIDGRDLDALRAHEHEHVRQYERWGALFLLAYPASSLAQWLKGRHPYWHNRFEIQARNKAANGESTAT